MTLAAVKPLARSWCYKSGLYDAYRRMRREPCLTTVMFHRILPPGDPLWRVADPLYTLSTTHFRQCLAFFRRHYSVVGPAQLAKPLPERPLLITFDDGWADTIDHGLPVLREAGVPAQLFVAVGAVGRSTGFWQERIFAAWKQGDVQADALLGSLGLLASGSPEGDIRRLIATLEGWPDERRCALVERIAPRSSPGPMASAETLRSLAGSPLSVGCHGFSHRRLTEIDAASDLDAAAAGLASMEVPCVPALSVPHGSYSPAVLNIARSRGFNHVFTSDKSHARLHRDGTLASDVIGRIAITTAAIAGGTGQFDPALLAAWLFPRPVH